VFSPIEVVFERVQIILEPAQVCPTQELSLKAKLQLGAVSETFPTPNADVKLGHHRRPAWMELSAGSAACGVVQSGADESAVRGHQHVRVKLAMQYRLLSTGRVSRPPWRYRGAVSVPGQKAASETACRKTRRSPGDDLRTRTPNTGSARAPVGLIQPRRLRNRTLSRRRGGGDHPSLG
jgi:hypothetical protein